MEFSIKNNILEKEHNACIIIGIFEAFHLSPLIKQVDRISNGYISAFLNRRKIQSKVGQTLLLHYIPNILSECILLVNCGKEKEIDDHQYKLLIQKAINILNKNGITEAVCFLTDLNVKKRNLYWKIRQGIEISQETFYTFDRFKSNKSREQYILQKIVFNIPTSDELIMGEQALQHGLAISAGVKFAKDLSNMPPNICNSSYLASQARQLADKFNKKITTYVVGEQEMKQLGMNAYLAVGAGSNNESLMSIIEYKGSTDEVRPIVLVGKGLTFDCGGISLKPSSAMDEMKYDMCGAASVYGIINVIAELNLPLNVVGVMACCENMLDSCSIRPGDIITTMSGRTVEILNTDAEGRLVLCDTLTYIKRFKPELVIDIATLTGACVIALGHHVSGLLSNHDSLAHELLNASEEANDLSWRLPMMEQYREQLKSNFADIANISSPPGGGGTITAACFLEYFIDQFNWAHLDIAGTAWRTGKDKGATGRPVPMISQFLLNRAGLNKYH